MQRKKNQEEERLNKTLDTKERSRARRTEISKKTDKKSTALDELVKKIGKAVEESKPYWEARRVARQVSVDYFDLVFDSLLNKMF